MANYVFIESRDPFTATTVARDCQLAADLADARHEVTLFLIQDGVIAARRCPHAEPLSALARRGVRVVADDFSLRERGIPADRLAAGIQPAPLESVVDALCDGQRVIWH